MNDTTLSKAKAYNPYPEYKGFGGDWLDQLPTSWEIKRISYITMLKSGDSIVSEQIKSEEKYPVFGGNGLRGYTNQFNHCGDYILIGRQGALCGNIHYAHNQFWASEHAVVVHPLVDLNLRWLGETLRAMNLNQYNVSAAQPGLAITNITCLKIPFPSLKEQTQIANFLDYETAKIDTLIDKQQQLIKLLKEKRQAVISHAVTKGLNSEAPMKNSGVEWLGEVPMHWVVVRLKFANAVQNDKTNSNENVIALENIESWTGNFIPTKSDFEGDGVSFTEGSILFGKLRPYLAKVYRTKENGVAFGDLIVFKPYNFVDAKYSFYQMISPEFIREVDSSTYGSKMPRASVDFIREMPFLLPPLNEQQNIASYIEGISSKFDSLVGKSTQAIKLMQERRTALISAAVTGKIDVSNWQGNEE